ncbi:alpha-mannosidase [Coleofasciculus sp.]|uniref:alpha-mannosidase n=1 Tax=Coleofasciculus sp. TaxID=3100458 RepID=UPI003A26A04D
MSSLPFLSDSIAKLRALTQVNVQTNWKLWSEDLPLEEINNHIFANGSSGKLNDKGYIIWSAGRQVMWLGQQFIIPKDLQGYPLAGLTLRLALTWWAEDAKIFVNGKLVQEGDLFDSSARVLLSSAVSPGEIITVMVRLVSPGHDIGGLMRSCCIYESINSIDPGFVADELTVLQNYLTAFAPEQLGTLAVAVGKINWQRVYDAEQFTRSLTQLRQNLLSQNLTPNATFHLLGHAHLDMAWLWSTQETWDVAVRTFESVLSLQQDFPDLTYCHTTPALYDWIEQNRPDLFSRIKQQVIAGKWETVGGMWVEPELNLIDGESIVRQILYGQRYNQEKFGQISQIAWVTDSFGFTWQLPQLLKQGGINYFVTQKLHWNDTTQFPYHLFWWQSPDGTKILSLMSPPNITGVMDTNPITMTNYGIKWQTQTKIKDIFWLPGVGDHGGGPTRDMLEVAQRWQQSPFFPNLEFTTALKYLQNLENQLENSRDVPMERLGDGKDGRDVPVERLRDEGGFSHIRGTKNDNSETRPYRFSIPNPIWKNELYLELHRGCYTTHADQKRWNRRCEGLLYQAELFASLATLITNKNYPQSQLETAWKNVLFNQFHDILPGTSIPEVFIEANQAWQDVETVTQEIIAESLSAIASQITLPSPPHPNAQPLIIFNPLNWQRSELITISLCYLEREPLLPGALEKQFPITNNQTWQIYDSNGEKIPSQTLVRAGFEQNLSSTAAQESLNPPLQTGFSLSEAKGQTHLLFQAKDIPAIGYKIVWLCPTDTPPEDDNPNLQPNNEFILENEYLRVIVNPNTGDLSSIFDKQKQREILSGAGNQLQAFEDKGQYWDAWNIDPNYHQHPLPPTQLKSIQWLEQGNLRSRLQVIRQLGQSQFCQDYILTSDSPLLKIVTTVDWQERQVLVKAAFPLNLEADYATYEIPCGAIQRPTKPQTPAEQAKWEVPALRWADLADETYGVSLLNDCKYGYDAQPSQLRLTLLKSPMWPHPDADRGIHHFTYALYPHSGTWQAGKTVQRGYELNFPLQVVRLEDTANQSVKSNGTDLSWVRSRHFSARSAKALTTNSKVSGIYVKLLPPRGSLLELSAENLVVIALKRSQDNPHRWILRCYECQGEEAEFWFNSDLGLAIEGCVDLLERPVDQSPESPTVQALKIAPWQIRSYAIVQT